MSCLYCFLFSCCFMRSVLFCSRISSWRQFLRNKSKKKFTCFPIHKPIQSHFSNVYQHVISWRRACRHPSEHLVPHCASRSNSLCRGYDAWLLFLSLTLLIRLMTSLFTQCWSERRVTLSPTDDSSSALGSGNEPQRVCCHDAVNRHCFVFETFPTVTDKCSSESGKRKCVYIKNVLNK